MSSHLSLDKGQNMRKPPTLGAKLSQKLSRQDPEQSRSADLRAAPRPPQKRALLKLLDDLDTSRVNCRMKIGEDQVSSAKRTILASLDDVLLDRVSLLRLAAHSETRADRQRTS